MAAAVLLFTTTNNNKIKGRTMAQTTYIVNTLRDGEYKLAAAFSEMYRAAEFISKAYTHCLDTNINKLPDYQVVECNTDDEGVEFHIMKIKPNYNITVVIETYPQMLAE